MERRDPTGRNTFDNMGGRGAMTKTPMKLQDLRRRIYAKAKAEPHWRFWGLSPESPGLRLGAVEYAVDLRKAYSAG